MSLEAAARRLIRLAFDEDLADGMDLTTFALIEPETRGQVDIVARKPGVAAGLITLPWVLEELAARPELPAWEVSCELSASDGDRLHSGQCLANITGDARSLLIAERTVLNILMHLSGIASLTARFVEAVGGLPVAILDTRKTLPGWRALEKYAVHCGGGVNHRMGLFDGVLIKDNHLASAAESRRTIAQSIEAARRFAPDGIKIEVEVDTLAQLREALEGGADIVLLDNMTPDELREAVTVRNKAGLAGRVQLEASGGVTLDTVRAIAESGVERISIGALTHSAPALDIGFDWQ
jgi:nicotinate-nucleotide pyrophosphorylase (carboxylating)